MRALHSYAKVQAVIARGIRNRRFQLRRARIQGLRYLDLGCGPNTNAAFINLDYLWHPKVDLCWDVARGLPFADGSLLGVFSEHCLEHFSRPEAKRLLCEIRRILAPGGRLRLVVPDAELYLRTYVQQLAGDRSVRFPYQEAEAVDPDWTPAMSVNRVYYQDRDSPFGHRTMFDFQMLRTLLRGCGFTDAERRAFGRGDDPVLLIDTPSRQVESLYVEAPVG